MANDWMWWLNENMVFWQLLVVHVYVYATVFSTVTNERDVFNSFHKFTSGTHNKKDNYGVYLCLASLHQMDLEHYFKFLLYHSDTLYISFYSSALQRILYHFCACNSFYHVLLLVAYKHISVVHDVNCTMYTLRST